MSRVGTITRRVFMVSSATIAGGFVLGYWSYKKAPYNPLLDEIDDGETTLNPYIMFAEDGISIVAPRTDLGQGVHSALAALVAEELEVSLDSINVIHGPPSPSYWNGKSMVEAFGINPTEEGFKREAAETLGDFIGKMMGMQGTGGSSSIPDAYYKMRKAGAAGREMLLMAAASTWSVSQNKLSVENGVIHGPNGLTASYMQMATEAAKFEPPKDPPLKSSKEFKLIGKNMQRVDMIPKCTGKTRFGIDQDFPDMVYASTRVNPHLESPLKKYDASAAEKMRGVLKVVPVQNGVAVIANNTWRAFKALQTIEVEWEKPKYPLTTEEMFSKVADSLQNEDCVDTRNVDDGNVEAALENSDASVEATYQMPFLAHAPLEPMSAVAKHTQDKLQIWTSNQLPLFMLDQLAKLTGLDKDQIEIHILMSGGSFGRRLECDYAVQAAEIAMQYPEVPVKMTWSREEDMTHDPCRPLAMAKGRGTVKDGKIESYDLHVASPSVVASQFGRIDFPVPGPDVTIVAGSWDQPFRFPNFRVTGYRTPPMTPISSWRSVGASINGFFFNSLFDELVEKAEADPLEERIRLCNHKESRLALEQVGIMSNWKSKRLADNQGRGVAFTLSFGVPTAEVVEVTNTPEGIKIDNVYLAMEVGQIVDPNNFVNQVQGGVLWGLSHAMYGEITFADGKVEQNNYHQYQNIRLNQVPNIEVKGLENGDVVRGAGEPPVPPVASALASAIYACTGKRLRKLPLSKQVDFV